MPWNSRNSRILPALAAAFALAFCLGNETSRASDDVFAEEMRSPALVNGFVTLEEANEDLAPGANEAPVTEVAPIDLIAAEEEPAAEAPRDGEERESPHMHPDEDAVAKREMEGDIEKITMKNGDVIMNVKQGADFEKSLSKALGSEFEAEAPIRESEDWAVLPPATR